MRASSSSTIALLTLALCFYAAPVVHATHASHPASTRQLSDQNLFEVHLQNGAASSHKRLPSEILSHHERSEQDDLEEVEAAAAALSSSSSSTKAASESPETSATTTSSKTANTFTARQPNHFIKHFKHRFAKRRLTEFDFETTHFERDSDDLDSSIWSVPALVARVLDTETSLWSRTSSEDLTSSTEQLPTLVHSSPSTPPSQ